LRFPRGKVSSMLRFLLPVLALAVAWGPCWGLQVRGLHRRVSWRSVLPRPAAAEESPELRVEDRDVPAAHKGLHSFLYSDEASHEASTTQDGVASVADETRLVEEWAAAFGAKKVAAVYAVFDTEGVARYVGITRHLTMSLAAHLREKSPSVVHSARVTTVSFPSKAAMEEVQAAWMAEYGLSVEALNGDSWSSTTASARAVAEDPADMAAYEDTKLKLRKAMADTTLADGEQGDSDWSQAVSDQTSEATGNQATASAGGLDFTMENIDQVLDEVRPYLVADGGNIKVLSIEPEPRNIIVELQGACGSCPSSTTTMKMGVERVLKEQWPDLGEVVSVSETADLAAELSTADVEAKLAQLLPAITGLGGAVTVASVDAASGKVELEYKGPKALRGGIDQALRDDKRVTEVLFSEAA